jgi:hypothetical protein
MVVRPKYVADNFNKIVNNYWYRVALDGKWYMMLIQLILVLSVISVNQTTSSHIKYLLLYQSLLSSLHETSAAPQIRLAVSVILNKTDVSLQFHQPPYSAHRCIHCYISNRHQPHYMKHVLPLQILPDIHVTVKIMEYCHSWSISYHARNGNCHYSHYSSIKSHNHISPDLFLYEQFLIISITRNMCCISIFFLICLSQSKESNVATAYVFWSISYHIKGKTCLCSKNFLLNRSSSLSSSYEIRAAVPDIYWSVRLFLGSDHIAMFQCRLGNRCNQLPNTREADHAILTLPTEKPLGCINLSQENMSSLSFVPQASGKWLEKRRTSTQQRGTFRKKNEVRPENGREMWKKEIKKLNRKMKEKSQ